MSPTMKEFSSIGGGGGIEGQASRQSWQEHSSSPVGDVSLHPIAKPAYGTIPSGTCEVSPDDMSLKSISSGARPLLVSPWKSNQR